MLDDVFEATWLLGATGIAGGVAGFGGVGGGGGDDVVEPPLVTTVAEAYSALQVGAEKQPSPFSQ